MASPDVCIAGSGIIGLTLALALQRRGLSVLVLEAGDAMGEASSAAAGMLAAEDPDNPPALRALAQYSLSLYPAFLESLREEQRPVIGFQTYRTLQAVRDHARGGALDAAELHAMLPSLSGGGVRFVELAERSLDPRELAGALIAAVERSTSIRLQLWTKVLSVAESAEGVLIKTSRGDFAADRFVDCTGAWSLSSAHVPAVRIAPRKGQMLTVPTPRALAGGIVLRTHAVYLVPRLHGERAGQTVIGATVEDAGFDRSVQPAQLADLLGRAAALLPELREAAIVASWSGLRPATPDLLPLLGVLPGARRLFLASGHYRNGILLAPGTAQVLTQVLMGETPAVSLDAFAPDR